MLQQSVELTEQTSRSLHDLEMMYQDLCDLLQPLPQPAPVPKRARVPAAAADAPAPPPGPLALPFPLQVYHSHFCWLLSQESRRLPCSA